MSKALTVPAVERCIYNSLRNPAEERNSGRLIAGAGVVVVEVDVPHQEQDEPDDGEHGEQGGDPAKQHGRKSEQRMCPEKQGTGHRGRGAGGVLADARLLTIGTLSCGGKTTPAPCALRSAPSIYTAPCPAFPFSPPSSSTRSP